MSKACAKAKKRVQQKSLSKSNFPKKLRRRIYISEEERLSELRKLYASQKKVHGPAAILKQKVGSDALLASILHKPMTF